MKNTRKNKNRETRGHLEAETTEEVGLCYRMNDNGIPKQALKWSPADGKRKNGRPRKNWKMTATEDLRTMEMDWDEAEQVAENRLVWLNCVAQCAGGTWKD